MRIPTEDETLAFANELIDHGVPVIVCKPDPKGTDAMIPTVSWSNVTTATPCRWYLADFVYGTDALALIGGHGIDLIDVDTKAGGTIAPFGDFRHHGVTATPSGGWHYVVTSTGQKRRQGVEIDGQYVGDYIGGTGDHGSRMIGYLPGSARPAKYGDTLYGFEEEWDVEGAVFGEPDPQVLAVLGKAGADQRAPDGYVDDSPERDPSLGLHPYARKAVDDELKRLDDLPHPWAPGSYWDNTTFEVACSLIRFANSGWTGYTLEQAEADLLAHAPADDQWGEREHRQKWSSATDAVGDTGRRNPDVAARDEFDVHTPVPLSAGAAPDPAKYVDPREGLLTAVLAADVAQLVTYAVDARDTGQFYAYREGRWDRGGTKDLTAAIAGLLGNRFRKSHLTNVLTYLAHRPSVREIDGGPCPRWINVANGLLDWQTGALSDHTPDVPSTVQLPVRWDPEAECRVVERFLSEVLPADCLEPTEGGPGFIWELLGYCLYSGNPHHVAVLLYGTGRNGKGALLRLIEALVGARNTSSVPLHDLSENRFRAASLHGRLLNVAGDLDARWLANTATFKAITGGDSVQAEHKYGAVFDFTPWALPLYSTNKAFGSADSSEGYLARWVVVPFPNSFLGREDRGLDDRLQRPAELEGVLRRAVEALPALMDRGRLPEPESVKAAKHRFITSGDTVRSWLDERCVLDRDAWTARTALWFDYEASSDDAGGGRFALGKREFYNRLAQVGGVTAAKRNGTDGFRGVRLLREGLDPLL